ncbi:hypothetical protein NQ317_000382 [Molorchus minor]|uniref:thioredoxin-dependent peroxiredoxin n=1 Tax=Molorchus minor TaxID=1323400 RepID=A0ABQ9J974_9CUCU|nr:hypothetical protein NQ317_000382 [Molorchus minor]
MTSHVRVSRLIMSVPSLQKPAPVFKGTAVVDGQFKEISLEDYKGQYVVFFFYPLDFTFVCPTEIIAFSDRAEEFKKNQDDRNWMFHRQSLFSLGMDQHSP